VAASDHDLLLAWRNGDREAGDELIARYFDPVCRFFRSKLGDDVEDLIQRTFIDCVQWRDRIAAPSFRSFLFSVARNRLFDHLRRALGDGTVELGSRSITDLGTRPSERVARHELRDIVALALRELPVDFQIALELAYWEDLDGPEIAAVLDVPHNTVRSRLSRGRKMLRDGLLARGVAAHRLVTGIVAEPDHDA
jgi:RNA polymerase sigma-70 factor (ECF subfamily)